MKKIFVDFLIFQETSEKQEEDTDIYNWDSGLHADENDDAHLYFSPNVGNVVFGSAVDGWAIQSHHAVVCLEFLLICTQNHKTLSDTPKNPLDL